MASPGLASRIPLLRVMERDIERHGALRRRTATAMWTAYAVHGATTLVVLSRSRRHPTSPGLRALGSALLGGGALLLAAGASRFGGARELEGTREQALTVAGVYRWSRNPQYVGYALLLGGAALRRSSLLGGALAALAGATYAVWVPVEEVHLARTFGEDYRAYARRTRRWVGVRSGR